MTTSDDEVLALRKQVEELEAQLSRAHNWRSRERLLEILERENAALRADRVRLDWLQSHVTSQIDWEDNGRTWYGAGETLRETIDAAREDADE